MITRLAFIFVLALSANAGDLRLGWDASPSPGVTNYVIYAGTNVLNGTNFRTAAMVRLNAGTNVTATVEQIKPGRWYFAATAMAYDQVESDLSNVVMVEIAEPPRNMRMVVVQYSGTLTNWYDVGFFRLRLP